MIKQKKTYKTESDKVFEDNVAFILKAYRIEHVRQYRIFPDRKNTVDFAILRDKIIIEVEGGIWRKGRHIRPQGFINDCEKYNRATMEGWKVYRIPTDWIRSVSKADKRFLTILDDIRHKKVPREESGARA